MTENNDLNHVTNVSKRITLVEPDFEFAKVVVYPLVEGHWVSRFASLLMVLQSTIPPQDYFLIRVKGGFISRFHYIALNTHILMTRYRYANFYLYSDTGEEAEDVRQRVIAGVAVESKIERIRSGTPAGINTWLSYMLQDDERTQREFEKSRQEERKRILQEARKGGGRSMGPH